MRFRKVPPAIIVRCLIEAKKANLDLDRPFLEAHFLAGGNLENLCQAMIIYKINGNNKSFRELSSLDLNGVDILTEAKNS